MSLSDELRRPWTPPRFVRPAQFEIELVAAAIERRFGGAGGERPPPRDRLSETERLLIEGEGDLSRLDRRHRKVLPWLLWDPKHHWSERPKLVDPYLEWADGNWRAAVRRLWRHYLLNLDPDSYATKSLAAWLAARHARLSETLGAFSQRWSLFEPTRGARTAAQALIDGQPDLLRELKGLGLDQRTILESAYMLAILEAVGQALRNKQPSHPDIAGSLKRLLTPLGEQPIQAMRGRPGRQERALKSLVEGVVAWAESKGGPAVDATMDLLHPLIGDPRLHPARWANIDQTTRETVEGWLSKVTLEAFFQVMAELQTDRPDMVKERGRFWRRYLQRISRAWLIVADDGVSTARRLLGRSFGRFQGANVSHDHCGLLLLIGNLVVLEMNKNGSTLLWTAGDPQMPGFFTQQYVRSQLLQRCSAPTPQQGGAYRQRLTHQGDWQIRYENEILRRTGIRPSHDP